MRSGLIASARQLPFDPLTLPNLVGWYDAADAATLTSVDGGITAWADKSPVGMHMTHRSGVTHVVEDINGRGAVRPKGGLMASGHSELVSTPRTAIGVFQVVDLISFRRPVQVFGVDFVYIDNTSFRSYDGQVVVTDGPRNALPHVGAVLRDPAQFTIRVDGAQSTVSSGNPRDSRGWVAFGGDGTTTRLGELIICTEVLAAETIADVEGYLAAKWGTPPRWVNFLARAWRLLFGGRRA